MLIQLIMTDDKTKHRKFYATRSHVNINHARSWCEIVNYTKSGIGQWKWRIVSMERTRFVRTRSKGWESSMFARLESLYFISPETCQRYTRAIVNSVILPYFYNMMSGDIMSHHFVHDRSQCSDTRIPWPPILRARLFTSAASILITNTLNNCRTNFGSMDVMVSVYGCFERFVERLYFRQSPARSVA